MAVPPVVRYMILCDDWLISPDAERRVHILGLSSQVTTPADQIFPLRMDLCVFLALTEGRGSGVARIVCVHDATQTGLFRSSDHTIEFGPDPLEIGGVGIRINQCKFPRRGLYSLQFWYDGSLVEERPFRVR
jgi:hypothetical protein